MLLYVFLDGRQQKSKKRQDSEGCFGLRFFIESPAPFWTLSLTVICNMDLLRNISHIAVLVFAEPAQKVSLIIGNAHNYICLRYLGTEHYFP